MTPLCAPEPFGANGDYAVVRGIRPKSLMQWVGVLEGLRAPEFWDDAENRRKLLSMVPDYRLSKFQHVLPDAWQVEMVGGYLLDFEGTKALLRG